MTLKKAFVLFLIFPINFIFSQTTLTAKVVGIKDGDTVVVLDSLNYQTTLRLAEVDWVDESPIEPSQWRNINKN